MKDSCQESDVTGVRMNRQPQTASPSQTSTRPAKENGLTDPSTANSRDFTGLTA